MNDLQISTIPIGNIYIGGKRRRLTPNWVVALANSISNVGLIHPIEVIEDGSGYLLISGAHRLAAVKQLGWVDIPVIVKIASEITSQSSIKMREIAENLVRNDLSVLDRAFDVAEWRDFYNATHLIKKGGRPKLTPVDEWEEKLCEDFALSFSEAARDALKISRRSVFHHLKVALIGEDLREQISLHAIADNQSELLALAAEPVWRRKDIVNMLTAEPPLAVSVSEAIALLDKVPALTKQARWQAFHSKFMALKASEQSQFFAANRDAILQWLEATKA
jgi:ParB family transcriptional regulator, chromosome partitioning protein